MKPGPNDPRHARSLNPDFSLCGLRRSTGIAFAASSTRVTCETCIQHRAEGRNRARRRLAPQETLGGPLRFRGPLPRS